mmetsp:Transcript_7760/g.13024  ORF Transcript_7760/g.13024 Transcript_7760/m.13024 type:complete len:107 (-) Transcript_7760:878-1198(-)
MYTHEFREIQELYKQQLAELDQSAPLNAQQAEIIGTEREMALQNIWSPQEIEQLIEGICTYQNDWLAISNNVFSRAKSPEMCVLKFLELPITENLATKVSSYFQSS